MVDLVEVNAAHLDAEGAIGEDIHGHGEYGPFFAEHLQLGHDVLLLVVVQHQVLALRHDGHYLLQVDQLALLLVLHVEVDGVDGYLHLTFLLAAHAVVARHELREPAENA